MNRPSFRSPAHDAPLIWGGAIFLKRAPWLGVRWLLLLVGSFLLLALPGKGQTTVPVVQWQRSHRVPVTCTADTTRDWAFQLVGTRDGGYISGAYTGRVVSTPISPRCAPPIRPALIKLKADGSADFRREVALGTFSGSGRLTEAIELVDGSGYAAAGFIGVDLLFARFDFLGNEILGTRLTKANLGVNAQAFSLREVLTTNAAGQLVSDGFIIGGLAADSANPIVVAANAETSLSPDEAAGPINRLFLLRLAADGTTVLWRRWFRQGVAGAADGGAIVRPVYANGTIPVASGTRVARAPLGALEGFVFTGGFLNPDTLVTGTDAHTNMVVVRTDVNGLNRKQVWVANRPYVTSNYYCNYADNFANFHDYGTDVEQAPTGEIIVTGVFNRWGFNRGCKPPANPNTLSPTSNFLFVGETYLLGWPKAFLGNERPTFREYLGLDGAGEFRPQVEVTPAGDYAVASGVLKGNGYELNRSYLSLYKRGSTFNAPLTAAWSPVIIAPPAVAAGFENRLACTFGLCLSQDGGFVISGNDNKFDLTKAVGTYENHDAVFTYLRACELTSSTAQVIGDGTTATAVTWTAPRRIRGEVRVKRNATLTIDGAEIQFDDTRSYQTTQSANPLNPTRVVVEAGGKLVVRNGARLTVLRAAAGCPSSTTPRMWDGIFALGTGTKAGSPTPYDPAFTQTAANQAVVELTDATLDNAHVGVATGGWQYNSATGVVQGAFTQGGAILTATRSTFRNCGTGIYFLPYSFRTTTTLGQNLGRVTACQFLADAPLADPAYTSTVNGVPTRQPMPAHIRAYASGIQLRNNTFTISDALATATPTLRGTGVLGNGGGLGAYDNVFTNLSVGLNTGNTTPGYAVVLHRNQFTGCAGGANLTASNAAQVYNNIFKPGRGNDTYALGLGIINCYGFAVENNQFSGQHTGCGGAAGCTTRGINVNGVDGPVAASPRPNQLRRNFFSYLGEGIFGTNANIGLSLFCNSFVGPTPDNPGPAAATIVSRDITIMTGAGLTTGLKAQQGRCLDNAPTLPANNLFSHTCARLSSARDVSIFNSNSGAVPLDYNYARDLNSGQQRTLPGGAVGTTCYTTAAMNPIPCGDPYPGFVIACPEVVPQSQTTGQIRTTLAATTDPAARAALLDELLRRYLGDTLYVAGLDSAVALLTPLNEPGYGEQLTALRQVGGYPPLASRPAPPTPTGTGTGWVARRAARRAEAATATPAREALTAAARTAAAGGTYFEQVRALLAPLGSEATIRATLRADSTLRGQLWAIARDTTAWGFVAGQAALTRYCGYRFRMGLGQLPPADEWGDETGARAAAPVAAPRPLLTLYPNPTTGRVLVRLAEGAAPAGRLVVWDAFGKIRQTVAWPAQKASVKAEEVVLDLSALLPGLYYYTYWVGDEKVQTGTLVRQP